MNRRNLQDELTETRAWVLGLTKRVEELERRSVIRVEPLRRPNSEQKPRPMPTAGSFEAMQQYQMFHQSRSFGPPPVDTPLGDIIRDLLNHLNLELLYTHGASEKKPSFRIAEHTEGEE